MAEPREELIDQPELEDEDAADVPLRAAEDEAEPGCTVEGGLVRL